MPDDARNFRYFNGGANWAGFDWRGLEMDAGALRLLAVPKTGLTNLPDLPAVPGGIAVSPENSVYVVDPAARLVGRYEGCFGICEELHLASFEEPVGVAITPRRNALLVADAGAGRIYLFDLASGSLIDLWEGFGRPVALAVDPDGSVYVADEQTGRVSRIFLSGEEDSAFGDRVAQVGPATPIGVAVAGNSVFVLDSQSGRTLEFDLDGELKTEVAGKLDQPRGLAADANAIYAGDNTRRVLTVYKRRAPSAYEMVVNAAGFSGPVAAVACGPGGDLWVYPGGAAAPVRFSTNAAHANEGLLWSPPLDASGRTVHWHRLKAFANVPAKTELQFYVHTADTPASPPVYPDGDDPFPAPWRRFDPGVTDLFVGAEARYLRVAVRFYGDGAATPSLHQLRADFDQLTYLEQLPEIYRDEGPHRDFLLRFLSLFESMFADVEDQIGDLVRLLDPQAAEQEHLPWLASFLGLEPQQDLAEERQRDRIASAFERSARRGTAQGLRQTIETETGARAVVLEPITQTAWWQLAAPSRSCKNTAAQWDNPTGAMLGVNSVLAGAEPQGAVVGSTAVIDRSHLLYAEEYGAPLFSELAHRFTVLVYRGQVDCGSTLEAIRAVIEREKPAHTVGQVSIVDFGLRIGYKATLGVDTVLGDGSRGPSRLGDGDLVLGGPPAGRLGSAAQVGVSSRL